jgi:hypothetical protein
LTIQWVLIRSVHALRPDEHFGPVTYCGRDAAGRAVSAELPAGKSCELCLRIVARIADDASLQGGLS